VARKKSPTLTEAELRLMNVIWAKENASVGDVVDALSKRNPLAYSTVLTTLRILEDKGYLGHRKSGRAFIYYPLIDRAQARSKALRFMISRFFNNSPELLVLNLLEEEKIDPEELERLKKRIEDSE